MKQKALFPRVLSEGSLNTHQRFGVALYWGILLLTRQDSRRGGCCASKLKRTVATGGLINASSCPGNRLFDRLTHRVYIQALQP